MQIKLPLFVAAIAVATTAMPAVLGDRRSPAMNQESGIDFKYKGRNLDDTSKDLKTSIGNAWEKLVGADKPKNHDKSSRSDKKPEDKVIRKIDFEWNSLTDEDKMSMSDFFNNLENNLDAALAKTANAAEHAADQVLEKLDNMNKKDD